MRAWGHVYIVNCNGVYKIGSTMGLVSSRVATIQSSNPNKIDTVCTIPSQRTMTLERDLHEKFKAWRVRGEWYRLTRRQIEDLRYQSRVAHYEHAQWVHQDHGLRFS